MIIYLKVRMRVRKYTPGCVQDISVPTYKCTSRLWNAVRMYEGLAIAWNIRRILILFCIRLL
jgi:hypothetical protein